MSLNHDQLVALKSELTNDPMGLGYVAHTSIGDAQGAANLLNAIGAGGAFQVNNEPVNNQAVENAITAADFDVMNSTNKQDLSVLYQGGPAHDMANDNTFAKFANCVPPDGQSLLNLTGLRKRQGRRSEVLFGNGVTVTANNVSDALALP